MSPRRRSRGLVTPPVDTLVDSDSDSDESLNIDADNDSADSLSLELRRRPPNSTRSSVSRYRAYLISPPQADQLHFEESNLGEENLTFKNGAQIEANTEQADTEQSPTERYLELGELGDRNQGMLLRSGSQLKGVKRFLRSSHSRRRRSLCVINLTSGDVSNNALEDQHKVHGTSSRIYKHAHESRHSSSRVSTAATSRSVRSRRQDELNFSNNARRARRSSRSPHKGGRRTTSGWSDYDDDDRTPIRHYKQTEYRKKHMYDRDQRDDLSDSDYSYTSSFTSTDGHATVGKKKKKMYITLKALILWGAFSRIMAILFPKGSSGNSLICKYLAEPVCRPFIFVGSLLWRQINKMVMLIFWMDTWMVSRNTKRNCCVCLPLLLLPPLLLTGGYHMYGRARFAGLIPRMPAILTPRRAAPSHLPTGDRQHALNLHHEVKHVLQQLQAEHQEWMSRSDVENLVRGMLTPEMEALKVGLLNMAKEGSSDQTALKINQHDARQRLLALEEHTAALVAKSKILDSDLGDIKSLFMGTLIGDRDKQSGDINAVRSSLNGLKGKIEVLQNEFDTLASFSKTCCLDEPSLMSMIQQQVSTKMSRIVGDDGKNQGAGGTDFLGWLNKNYVDHEELETQLLLMTQDITDRIKRSTSSKSLDLSSSFLLSAGAGNVPEESIRLIVEDALLKYSADKTGLPDYALESAGGSVLNSRCSETYAKKTAVLSVFGIPLFYLSNSPRSVIQPEVHPGQCWAFKGEKGHVVIQLAVPIRLTGFSMEHIPRSLSIHGNIDSAPKDFSVVGLRSETDYTGINLGNFTYQSVGTPIQYFDVQIRNPGVFAFVQVNILSNHGDREYTCVYRFRAHGVPQN
ncbi:hypothetical protein ACOMHN_055311 [Nucella lapillus]